MRYRYPLHRASGGSLLLVATVLGLNACDGVVTPGSPPDDGYAASVESGREFFRDGTLGTQGYWSVAVGLGRGLVGAEVTTLDALELGLQFDSARLDPPTLSALLAELGTDLSPMSAPRLNDSALFQALLADGAVIGLRTVDENGDGQIDLSGPDTLGIACALCHSTSDGSLFDGALGSSGLTGTIGLRLDGPAPTSLDLGGLFALAENSRALYPYLPQSHETLGGEPIGRTGAFVLSTSSEAEVDALLTDRADFPLGMWDMLPDGIGAPTMLPPVYDIRPAAPYGTAGEFTTLMDAINAHVTLGLDPTTLITPSGAFFLDRIALGVGTELVDEFDLVLKETQVTVPIGGFPFAEASTTGAPLTPQSPVGLRLDTTMLRDLVTYLQTLREPDQEAGDPPVLERGELLYEAACAECHGALRGMEPHQVISFDRIRVAYAPTTLLQRGFPFSNVLDDRLTTFDDRLVIFDRLYAGVEVPSAPRVVSAPHLTGLHVQTHFLHDGSVASLDELLDPARGAGEPHPFYFDEPARSDLIEYLTRR